MKLKAAIYVTLTLLAVGAGSTFYFALRDFSHYFENEKGNLVSSRSSQFGEDAAFTHQSLLIVNDKGLNVECGLLVPKREAPSRRYPAVVLLGGAETGKEAIRYITGMSNVIIAAPDYQYKRRPIKGTLQLLEEIPAIRKGALQTVSSVMLLIDYLSRRPDVDPKRIVVAGYSFGAPFVPCVAAIDRRPAVAAMAYGAGDIRGLVRHNFKSIGAVKSELLSLLAALILSPIEPLRYADRIAPIPLLMINGTQDELIPPKYAEEFFKKARQPKKLIWLRSGHMTPENWALTRRITQVMRDELIGMGVLDPR
jgi:dienelactone hydrolase